MAERSTAGPTGPAVSRKERPRWGRWAVAFLVLTIAGLELFAFIRDDGKGGGGVAPRLESLQVEVDDFRAAWNRVVGAAGTGDHLGAPAWAADPTIGLESWSTNLGAWGTLDLYRRPGSDDLAGVELLGIYGSSQDRARFRTNAVAAVAAGLALESRDAESFLVAELHVDEARLPAETNAERTGTRVTIIRTATTAQLRIAVPNAASAP